MPRKPVVITLIAAAARARLRRPVRLDVRQAARHHVSTRNSPRPTSEQTDFGIARNGVMLNGWLVNIGKPNAIIYFGGNAERIEDMRERLRALVPRQQHLSRALSRLRRERRHADAKPHCSRTHWRSTTRCGRASPMHRSRSSAAASAAASPVTSPRSARWRSWCWSRRSTAWPTSRRRITRGCRCDGWCRTVRIDALPAQLQGPDR